MTPELSIVGAVVTILDWCYRTNQHVLQCSVGSSGAKIPAATFNEY